MTKLAVLIPVYRNQGGLNRSLESLREADGNFDVLIVDDGSPEPISVPSQLRDDVPVTLVRLEQNQGIASALNHGLRHILARGYSYVGRLDAGDTVAPERFDQQRQYLHADPNCAVVSSFVDFVDQRQTWLFRYRAPCGHREILRRLRLNNCLVHSGLMMRASAVQEVGLYRQDVPAVEDYELVLRMAQRYTLAVLPAVLTHCEYSFQGISVADRQRQQKERLKLQLRYFDFTSPYSFYDVARTLIALLIPHDAVFRFKCAYLR
jgi:glycosyltransferase involved in cell wall biosynthesis